MTDKKIHTEETTTTTTVPVPTVPVETPKSPDAFRRDIHEMTKPTPPPTTTETYEKHEKTTTDE